LSRPAPTPISVTTSPKGKQVTVRPLVRPELDAKKPAMALLQMTEEMTPEERARFAAEGEKLAEKKRRAA